MPTSLTPFAVRTYWMDRINALFALFCSPPIFFFLLPFLSFLATVTFVRRNLAQWRQLSVSLPRRVFFLRWRNSFKILNDRSASFAINARISRVYVTNEPKLGKLSELLRYGGHAQSTPAIALRDLTRYTRIRVIASRWYSVMFLDYKLWTTGSRHLWKRFWDIVESQGR